MRTIIHKSSHIQRIDVCTQRCKRKCFAYTWWIKPIRQQAAVEHARTVTKVWCTEDNHSYCQRQNLSKIFLCIYSAYFCKKNRNAFVIVSSDSHSNFKTEISTSEMTATPTVPFSSTVRLYHTEYPIFSWRTAAVNFCINSWRGFVNFSKRSTWKPYLGKWISKTYSSSHGRTRIALKYIASSRDTCLVFY